MKNAGPTFLLGFVLPSLAACAIPTRVAELNLDIPRQATPVAIDSGLKAMDDPETKQRMARMLASPEMKAVERELVTGILDSSLAALDEKDRSARIGELGARYAAGVLRAFSREMGAELGPALSSATRGAVKGAMDEGLSASNRRAMEQMVEALVQASMRPIARSFSEVEVSPALAAAMTRELGPALQKVLRDNLGPGLAEALGNEEVKDALGSTAHLMGREMVLGANEGLAKINENKPSGGRSVLESVSNLADRGATLAKTAAWALGVVVVLLGIWVVRLLTQRRRYRTESERRAATARLITEAMQASEGKDWSDELLDALEERFREDDESLLRIRSMQHKRRSQQPERSRTSDGRPSRSSTSSGRTSAH